MYKWLWESIPTQWLQEPEPEAELQLNHRISNSFKLWLYFSSINPNCNVVDFFVYRKLQLYSYVVHCILYLLYWAIRLDRHFNYQKNFKSPWNTEFWGFQLCTPLFILHLPWAPFERTAASLKTQRFFPRAALLHHYDFSAFIHPLLVVQFNLRHSFPLSLFPIPLPVWLLSVYTQAHTHA